jgi:nucleoside-diphosphate-sugar epimerase
MQSDYRHPLNLGSERLVSINELAEMIARIAGKRLSLEHVAGPQGVRGRNSDNSLLRQVLGWEPQTSLEDGLAATYRWIAAQLAPRLEVELVGRASVPTTVVGTAIPEGAAAAV